MNDEEMEIVLSKLFSTAVGDPPDHVTLSGIRRQVVRRRVIKCATATAAVALAGSIGLTSAPPRYYAELGISGEANHHSQVDVIRSTATGAITGKIRCPWAKSSVYDATASTGAFFINCSRGELNGGRPTLDGSRIYRFTVSGSGHASRPVLVPGTQFAGGIGGLGVSADGSEVVVTTGGTGSALRTVVVVNTTTGAHATWTGGILPSGAVFNPEQVSLTGNGKVLAAFGRVHCPKTAAKGTCKSADQEMIEVSPASKGGSLVHGREVFQQSWIGKTSQMYINAAFINASGKTATVGVVNDAASSGIWAGVVSVKTGRVIKVQYLLTTSNGFSYRFITADPTGQFVLFDAGPPRGALVNGWVDHGHLVHLKPADGNLADTEAW
jgi:hypothetical protein